MAAGGATGQRVNVQYFNLCAEERRRTSSSYVVSLVFSPMPSKEPLRVRLLTNSFLGGGGCAAQEASCTVRVN